MKSNLYKYTFITSIIIAFLFSNNSTAQENDISNYKMMFKFNSFKQSDNSRLLEVSFIAKNKKDRKDKVPVYDAEIKFFNILNDEEVLLGTAKTSKEGIAKVIVPESQKYLTDADGNINLTARFEATEALDEEEDEIIIKNLNLVLNLAEIDSVKTVSVKAFTIDSLGVEVPLEEADINFYIESMLSKMKIEEGSISDGEYEFELNKEIPGDANGNITVIAMIEDNDDFGNITQKKTVNWGTFNKITVEESNTLWSEAAPIWMYVVLTILLVGVWANFLYTIINLIKIKKEGQDEDEELEEVELELKIDK
ncbi:hypothetical protein [Lutibacter sp. B1]|uniref:hypothetical protein n=1 Tax=Lutibacter sp. B1 TaxID=2725996 RepID=UPI00145676C3|nr:hypothetical protein [Lutibacter sp. B1]NLP56772.1 hypothetical protein [Lutibacter sp. B1]